MSSNRSYPRLNKDLVRLIRAGSYRVPTYSLTFSDHRNCVRIRVNVNDFNVRGSRLLLSPGVKVGCGEGGVVVNIQNVMFQIFCNAQSKRVRPHSLYSTVDGSRQGFFWLVRKKKIKNKIC